MRARLARQRHGRDLRVLLAVNLVRALAWTAATGTGLALLTRTAAELRNHSEVSATMTLPRDEKTAAARPAAEGPPHGAPAGFRPHTHRYSFAVQRSRETTWSWLSDPDTFVGAARWPWRVEFVGGGFEPGVLAAHHGPGMNFAGILADIRPPEYRDLRYFYGSYALSLRLARPTRLQFWLNSTGRHECVVTLQVDAWVRPWVAPAWTAVQRAFWPSFARSARAAVGYKD